MVQLVGQVHLDRVIMVVPIQVLLYKHLVAVVVLVVLVLLVLKELVQEEMVFHLISQEVE